MQAKLIPLDKGRPITITQDVTIVGRKRGVCDLMIEHPSISKIHCAIARTDGLLFIRDLGSTNGTKVNGQRVLRGAILPGDELSFAKVKYEVFMGPDVPSEVLPNDQTEVITRESLDDEGEQFAVIQDDEDDPLGFLDMIDDADDV
ncbi:MAG: FHA domain-containing protein [Planctomycetaceae bacterium]|nr:FHA domain-containing protein [Planctomycetaceae bacterium]